MSETQNRYTGEQVDLLLDMYFRDHSRPVPYSTIARAMVVVATVATALPSLKALDRFLWGIITGYSGRDANGPRRKYSPGPNRQNRIGCVWFPREDRALFSALAGDGQLRKPPCDVAYISAVLARSVVEVEARWRGLNVDVLGREGFF